jgi:hypothetical protein
MLENSAFQAKKCKKVLFFGFFIKNVVDKWLEIGLR